MQRDTTPVTTSLRKLAPTEVELDIEVSPADFAQAQDRAYRKLVTRYKLPGFRAGHVPRKIFEQHIGKSSIDSQALEDLVPEVYAQALKEHQLEPVDRPHIDLDRSDEQLGLRIKAKVAVRPEINLADYRGMPADRPAVAVTEEEVDHSIDALRKRAALLEPVEDRGVQDGDTITMDYKGHIDGKPFEGGTAENHTTEVSADRFVPGFADQLHGAKPGESRQVRVTFPANYRAQELAGKDAVFDVTVHEIKRAVLPELNDEFVKQISDHENIAALRDDVRRRLEAVAQANSNEHLQRQLLDALLVRNDVPLPEVLVEREVDNLVSDGKSHLQRIGRSWEEYLAARNIDEPGLRKEYRQEAERRVKTALLLEEIAKREKIEATTADIEQELDAMARSYGQPRDVVIDVLRKSTGFGPIMDTVSRRKTLDFLVANASISDVAAVAHTHG
jgi:trigger factor